MTKRKRNLHKIVIHPNRYLIWALVFTFIVAFGLVAYISIGNINQDSELGLNQDLRFWHSYKDEFMTFRYPAEWLADPGPGYIGFGSKDTDVFIIYSYTSSDPAYENYLKLSGVKQITIGGKSGIEVADYTKDRQRIAFVKDGNRLYEFRGTTGLFDKILRTVHFFDPGD